MQSANGMSVKCKPNNFGVASCNTVNLLSCELQFNQCVNCKLCVNNQAVCSNLYQSTLYQVCIISLYYFKFACKTNNKIYCGLNENELEKYASIYAKTDKLQNQLFTGNRMTVLQILENS